MSDPFLGPPNRSDIRPLTDDAEIRECRLIEWSKRWPPGHVTDEGEREWEEILYGAARDLEEWGCNPFEEN